MSISEEKKCQTSADTPPKVKWDERKYRERTPNHRETKGLYQAVVSEVWARLPPSARIVICDHYGWHHEVYLMSIPPDEDSRFAELWAWHKSGAVFLNVHGCNVLMENDEGFRSVLVGHVAHELAHVFLNSIGTKAQEEVYADARRASLEERRSNPEQAVPESAISSVTIDVDESLHSAFGLGHDSMRRIIGLDDDAFDSPLSERLADAVMIAWGFGREFIQLSFRDGVPDEDELERPPHGLEFEVLRMTECLNSIRCAASNW